jgi:hypothetical protein
MNLDTFRSNLLKRLELVGIKANLQTISEFSIPHDCPPKPEHLMTKPVSHKTAYVHQVIDSPIYSNSRYKGD